MSYYGGEDEAKSVEPDYSLPELVDQYDSVTREIVRLIAKRYELKNMIDHKIDSTTRKTGEIDQWFRENDGSPQPALSELSKPLGVSREPRF